MNDTTVDILGTKYRIRKIAYKDDPAFEKCKIDGYCDSYTKNIVFCDLSTDKKWDDESEEAKCICEKATIRHEIVHAFLEESGLSDSANSVKGAWTRNEEMVDWFAIQSPKIFKIFKELDLL